MIPLTLRSTHPTTGLADCPNSGYPGAMVAHCRDRLAARSAARRSSLFAFVLKLTFTLQVTVGDRNGSKPRLSSAPRSLTSPMLTNRTPPPLTDGATGICTISSLTSFEYPLT